MTSQAFQPEVDSERGRYTQRGRGYRWPRPGWWRRGWGASCPPGTTRTLWGRCARIAPTIVVVEPPPVEPPPVEPPPVEQPSVAAPPVEPPPVEPPPEAPAAPPVEPSTPVAEISAFRPVPVENPGGGRIRDKTPPSQNQLVIVRGVGGRRIPLRRECADAWRALVAAARADGLAAPLLLPTSGFRDPNLQRRLWENGLKKYGSPEAARRWVAPPGHSPHQTGRAIDFYLGGQNSSANVARLRTLPAYRWMVANARRFGFYPYTAEPWHWEYNPPAQGSAAPTSGEIAILRRAHCQPPGKLSVAERTALAVTSNFETGTPFGCVVSRTSDPDGISMGMIQWNLRARTLQGMLRAFEQRGGSFQAHFGNLTPALRRLLAMPQGTHAEVEAMIAEARRLRLASPGRWEGALMNLCTDPIFCQLQVEDLRHRFAAVWPAVRRLGLRTIRGLCMLFDVYVGDGFGARRGGHPVRGGKIAFFARRIHQREVQKGSPLTEREKLVEIAEEAARFAGRWSAERRARRLVIANGHGLYRRSQWNLQSQFPNLDNPL